ncbi:hypothetical protein CROQUDRAFT_23554, partial [Cronartium quercuum f. sp. fusiforme G11]
HNPTHNDHEMKNDDITQVQTAILKQLKKDFPTSKDWPTFDGAGEYNHEEFITWVDRIKNTMHMPDELIVAKLTIVFEKVARTWLLETMEDEGEKTWEEWKTAIRARFGTDIWRDKMEQAFNKNRYNPIYHTDVVKWATDQKQRIKAFAPESSKRKIIDRMLWKINGDIRNNVLSRLSDSDSWGTFLVILEDICKHTSLGKK